MAPGPAWVPITLPIGTTARFCVLSALTLTVESTIILTAICRSLLRQALTAQGAQITCDGGQGLIKYAPFFIGNIFSCQLPRQGCPAANMLCCLTAEGSQKYLSPVGIAAFPGNQSFFQHCRKTAGNIGLIPSAKLTKPGGGQTVGIMLQHHQINGIRPF